MFFVMYDEYDYDAEVWNFDNIERFGSIAQMKKFKTNAKDSECLVNIRCYQAELLDI